jgi:2-polyprenyl-3-methyl-5-hydroxy-6-metoxy-1,4-benzoquinol methylase
LNGFQALTDQWPSALEAILCDLGVNPGDAAVFQGQIPEEVPAEKACLLFEMPRPPSGGGRTFSPETKAMLQLGLASSGYLLVHARQKPALPSIAALRNALWPEFHCAAVYLLESEKHPVRRELSGALFPLKDGKSGETDRGFVLAAIHTSHAMNPEAVKKKFDLNAPGWNSDPRSPTYGHFRWMRKIVADCARPVGDERILDAGCGAGWVGIEAAHCCGRVSAFDPSPEMVRIASKNAEEVGVQIDFEVGFTEEPPFEKPFDKVISAGVISFSPDHEKFLNGLDSMLEPGGTLVIADVNPRSLGMRYRRARHPLLPLRELNALARSEVESRLKSRGYQIEKKWHYQLTLPVPLLMHLAETRFKGLGTSFLLWLNKAAFTLDAALGSPAGILFDSYILRARKRGSIVA